MKRLFLCHVVLVLMLILVGCTDVQVNPPPQKRCVPERHMQLYSDFVCVKRKATMQSKYELAYELTPREREVLQLLAFRIPRDEIAEMLGVKRPTVCTHIEKIYQKLFVNCRFDAVKAGHALGLIDAHTCPVCGRKEEA